MLTGTIETLVHGRYLYEDRGAERLLVGFHGYAEDAEIHIAALQTISAVQRWSVVAIQALHPFYTRSGNVVASWMTSLDREQAVADNLAYIRKVLATLPAPRTLVFAGFSQGASMAARAAADNRCSGLMMLGGDVPADVKRPDVQLPPVLLGRGTRDDWYTEEKLAADTTFLETVTRVTGCVFEGGHEWSDEYRAAATKFLGDVAAR